MTQTLEFDIAIIGGGMVGTSLASLLAAGMPSLRIVLIESQPFADIAGTRYQPGFDARSTALSYGSVDIFRELGLWAQLKNHVTPIHQVHVSDRGHFGGGVIEAADQGVDAVGFVVENTWLSRVLLEHVQQQTNLHCFAPAKVNKLTPLQQGALLNVQFDNQEIAIKTSLAVIADGGDSPLRRALGIATEVRDYRQTALIANVEFSEPHQAVAYERFTADGPMALLPLGESPGANQSALVWTLPKDQAATIAAMNEQDFLAELQARFGFRVGRFIRVSKRYAYPLQLVIAQEQIRSHLVLVGNAAHFLHPVAGQGFNLALRDCACLVEVLRDANEPLGSLAALERYRQRQQLDQQLTIEFSDRLVRLFSNSDLPLMALRHLGFLSLETIPLLKNQFVAQTMGTGGRRFRWHPEGDTHLDATPHSNTIAHLQQAKSNAVDVDLVIVGAGLVGAALGCAVAQKIPSLRIAVIEAGGEPQVYSDEHFDPRVVALTHASQRLLTDIGCWDAIAAARVCAYRQMKVWDGEGTASIEFDAAEVRQNHLGHIVENSVIVRALRARIAQHSQIRLLQPLSVTEWVPADGYQPARIGLSDGSQLTASLVVAADGAQSRVRGLAHFATREWDYDQQAIVTTVRTEKSHEFTAWQRFMHTGPLAFLPLQYEGDSHWCSIVWSAENSLADELMALNDGEFCSRLTSAFEARLGKVESCAERIAIPLRQRHATTYIQPGIALVGDAAHNIHPLAGQGVNLGLLDVIALVEEVQRAQSRGIPLDDFSILRRYQRQRLANNLGMMSAMEGFNYLFGSRSLAIGWLRNTGMRELNSMSAIKKIIINSALGVS